MPPLAFSSPARWLTQRPGPHTVGRPSQAVLRREAARYAREEVAWLRSRGHARWLPYAAVYEGAKFAGLQLGARHARLPLALKRRLSASPAFWS